MINLYRLSLKILFSLICVSHFTCNANASQSTPSFWQIKPKVCLVEKLGQTCEILLNVKLNRDLYLTNEQSTETEHYCLFLDDTKLLCFMVIDNQSGENITSSKMPDYDLRLMTANHSMLTEALEASEVSEGLNIKLVINNESRLTIQNSQNKVVHSQTLSIKARKASKKTRRVREPWSLF